MTMTFRQGIHKNRKEQYLAVKNDGVYVLCENEPLIVNFANGANDYIHLESVTNYVGGFRKILLQPLGFIGT